MNDPRDAGANDSSVRAAYRRLAAAQKNSSGTPAYSRYVNRPVGRILAAIAYRLGLTPNQVTMVSAVVTFASVAVLVTSSGSWWVGVVVAIGLALGYALDSADGQVARLRGGGSMVGEWLDHMIDSAKITTVHLAVAVVAYRTFDIGTWWLLVPLAFTVVANVHFFGMIFVDQLVRLSQATSGTATPPSRAASSRALMLGKIPLDYGFLCWVFVLIGSPPAFCVVYSIIAAGSAAYLLLTLNKWRSDIAGLDRARAAAAASSDDRPGRGETVLVD